MVVWLWFGCVRDRGVTRDTQVLNTCHQTVARPAPRAKSLMIKTNQSLLLLYIFRQTEVLIDDPLRLFQDNVVRALIPRKERLVHERRC